MLSVIWTLCFYIKNKIITCEIWGFYGGAYSSPVFLGYDAV